MKPGRTLRPGDVVLAKVQFTDTFEIKTRPALVLFEEFDNVVLAGITSNTRMQGILLSREDGAIKDSIIKLNYLFTVSSAMISRVVFSLAADKRKEVFDGLVKKIEALVED